MSLVVIERRIRIANTHIVAVRLWLLACSSIHFHITPPPLHCRQQVILICLLIQSPTRSVQTGIVMTVIPLGWTQSWLPAGWGCQPLFSWSWVWCKLICQLNPNSLDCQTSPPVVIGQRGCHYYSSLHGSKVQVCCTSRIFTHSLSINSKEVCFLCFIFIFTMS